MEESCLPSMQRAFEITAFPAHQTALVGIRQHEHSTSEPRTPEVNGESQRRSKITRHPGMRWTPEGLDALLPLRTAVLNGSYEVF